MAARPRANQESLHATPLPSQQASLRETRIPPASNDHVIVDRNVEQLSSSDELLCHLAIVHRRRRIAARMVVHEDHRRRTLGDCLAKAPPRTHEGGIEDA